jgi:signal transduction histidine kinase
VVVVVSQRAIQQNRELAGKRRLDERRAAHQRVARDLLARVEARPATAVALTAAVESGRLVVPWESDPATHRFQELMAQPGFAAAIARAEQAEFAGGERGAAVERYREAVRAARHPAQVAYARLLLARALDKQGRAVEALAEARQVLRAPAGLVDEDGVSLRVHAATLLASSAADRPAVRQALDTDTEEAARRPSPIATFALSNLADRLEGTAAAEDGAWLRDLRARIGAAIRLQEQVQALQSDAGRLGLLDAPSWTYYSGPEPWLVRAELTPERSGRLTALRARDVFAPFERTGELRFLAPQEPGGELLGDSLPGLKVAFADTGAGEAAASLLESRIYYLALGLLVAATAFGSWTLWRGLNREMQLAETRAQFVSSVSHELKTPLTSIRMFAETLQMGRASESSRGEYLETIINESERLSRLVDDVLLFSKIEQGAKAFRLRPVSLSATLEAAARALSYPLAQHGFELRVDMAEDVPEMNADPDALQQAVLNLLTNAMKYSGDSRRIELRLARRGAEAVVEVTDHGVGIAPDQQARIFEKYYRVPAPENQNTPGTGLGLTLVEQIAKAHGGRVAVASVPGQGSTFAIHLPIQEGA